MVSSASFGRAVENLFLLLLDNCKLFVTVFWNSQYMSEDISGCKQEKEERQAEENRLRMKQEEREDATLSRETQGQQEALAENKGE